jgi:hypothetical protein
MPEMDAPGFALDKLTVAAVWAGLDAETRREAARALYEDPEDGASAGAGADAAIARAIRFRLLSVRRLPLDKRIDYIVRVVRPDESLASSLLRALHLVRRRDLLAGFLDELGIPHENGVIDPAYDFANRRPDAPRLRAALEPLDRRFGREQVDLYALTLLAMDPDAWAGLAEVLEGRRARGQG